MVTSPPLSIRGSLVDAGALNSTSKSRPAILGGDALRSRPFPERRTMGDAEKKAAMTVLDSDCLSSFLGAPGPYFDGGVHVRAFEGEWARMTGTTHALTFNSLTTGLTAAMGAVGIEPGDEVICPPYTMSASATSALFYGGIPVFADIDPETFCIDPVSVAKCITPRTRAIVAVHLFGHPADMDALLALCKPRGIALIEDAAQAPGCRYKGRAVGAIGTVGGFSLNYHKHIHTGEGGVMTTSDPAIARRLSLIRNHGENISAPDAEVGDLASAIGSNYRLTELQAAIGSAQLPRLEGILRHRRALASRLSKRLMGFPGITPAVTKDGCEHGFYMYAIRYDAEKVGLSRSHFVRSVAAELPVPAGWESTPLSEGYVKPLYLGATYQRRIALGRGGFPFNLASPEVKYVRGMCPVTERAYEKDLLVTPLVREPLTETDINDFADAIEKVLTHARTIRDSGVLAGDNTPFTPVQAAARAAVR